MVAIRSALNDGYETATSELQAETERIFASHFPPSPSEGKMVLEKGRHISFIARALLQGFPMKYISQDASQPWLIFWALQGLSITQVALDPGNKQRVIDTVLNYQHPDGGFGGGPGQFPHLLPTYASVCALAIAGRPGPDGGWDQIDRKKMYDWFMSLKQPDGAFLVSHDAEVDVRGLYCLLVTATLLNLLTSELLAGVPQFIISCQSYEGGFSSASHPYFSSDKLLDYPRPALGEAHGGYTFSSLASWVLIQPYLTALREAGRFSTSSPEPQINLRSLLRWMSAMQGGSLDLGGFRGRTNKLVDGCYSWWVGGCFPLIEALGVSLAHDKDLGHEAPGPVEEEWADVDDAMFDRRALQEYILCAGQHPAGGLRDKPPKHSDAYHTCYCLSGLASAQHRVVPSDKRKEEILKLWNSSDVDEDPLTATLRRLSFANSLSWVEEEGGSKVIGVKENLVNATHPVFNLTNTHTEGITSHFYRQILPPRRGGV